MSFEFKKCKLSNGTEIKGLYEIFPSVIPDSRGYFTESFNKIAFDSLGVNINFVQHNVSKSKRGVLRGLHFQTIHPQAKLQAVLVGRVYDVAVDLRAGSPAFGKYYGVILDSEKQNMFYIPEGFAHGFYVLSDEAIFTYKCTDFYDPTGEGGLMWNDPLLGIDWKAVAPNVNPLLSEKDGKHPPFNPSASYFDINGEWLQK